VFVCAGVGDCKAYAYSQSTHTIIDFTSRSRANSGNDASDPGGRLGPYLGTGEPDLRNFDCYAVEVREGDLIFIVSDGIHDNLDPETLGKSPLDLNLPFEEWSVDFDEATHLAKIQFAEKFAAQIICEGLKEGEIVTPEHLVHTLIAHAKKTTEPARKWLIENERRLPKDYTRFPGKMDHTTCVCFIASMVPDIASRNILSVIVRD